MDVAAHDYNWHLVAGLHQTPSQEKVPKSFSLRDDDVDLEILFGGQFSDIPMALQLLEFPLAFLDWRRSDGLIPQLPNAPAVFTSKPLPASEEEAIFILEFFLFL